MPATPSRPINTYLKPDHKADIDKWLADNALTYPMLIRAGIEMITGIPCTDGYNQKPEAQARLKAMLGNAPSVATDAEALRDDIIAEVARQIGSGDGAVGNAIKRLTGNA